MYELINFHNIHNRGIPEDSHIRLKHNSGDFIRFYTFFSHRFISLASPAHPELVLINSLQSKWRNGDE